MPELIIMTPTDLDQKHSSLNYTLLYIQDQKDVTESVD